MAADWKQLLDEQPKAGRVPVPELEAYWSAFKGVLAGSRSMRTLANAVARLETQPVGVRADCAAAFAAVLADQEMPQSWDDAMRLLAEACRLFLQQTDPLGAGAFGGLTGSEPARRNRGLAHKSLAVAHGLMTGGPRRSEIAAIAQLTSISVGALISAYTEASGALDEASRRDVIHSWGKLHEAAQAMNDAVGRLLFLIPDPRAP